MRPGHVWGMHLQFPPSLSPHAACSTLCEQVFLTAYNIQVLCVCVGFFSNQAPRFRCQEYLYECCCVLYAAAGVRHGIEQEEQPLDISSPSDPHHVTLADRFKAQWEQFEEAQRRKDTRMRTIEQLDEDRRRQEAVFEQQHQAEQAVLDCAELDPADERFNSTPQLQRL